MQSSTAVLREAVGDDVSAIVELLVDDQLGANRDGATTDAELQPYLHAFDAIDADPAHLLLVAADRGQVVATMQLSFIPGLARRGALRAQIEAVRVKNRLGGRRYDRRHDDHDLGNWTGESTVATTGPISPPPLMRSAAVPRLSNGETFPSLQLPLVGGGTLSLPDDLAGDFGVVLVYRGAWCPYCAAQLAAFSRAKEDLDAAGIKVVAFSVDDEPTTAGLVEKRRLTFPVAHSADADKVADALGAYVNDDPHYLQSTGFVLAPDGAVVTAVYSSGAIGRLVPDDVIGLVRYIKEHG